MTDVAQMPIDGPTPNQPASGTQGSQSQVDALKKAIGLPPPAKQPQGGAPSMPTMPAGAKPAQLGGPFGLPSAITAPTGNPNVPAQTPLAVPQNPVAQAGTLSDKNRALIDMIARSPDVSPETKEWAMQVKRAYGI